VGGDAVHQSLKADNFVDGNRPALSGDDRASLRRHRVASAVSVSHTYDGIGIDRMLAFVSGGPKWSGPRCRPAFRLRALSVFVVEAAPPQTQQLSEAKSAEAGDQNEGAGAGIDRVCESPHLVRRQEPHLLMLGPR